MAVGKPDGLICARWLAGGDFDFLAVAGKNGAVTEPDLSMNDVRFDLEHFEHLLGGDFVLESHGGSAVIGNDFAQCGEVTGEGLAEGDDLESEQRGRGDKDGRATGQQDDQSQLAFDGNVV